MLRKAHYYLRFLREDEYEKFITNLDYGKQEYLEREFDNFRDFIASGFIWSDSNEGHWYWSNISYRKINDGLPFKGISRHSML